MHGENRIALTSSTCGCDRAGCIAFFGSTPGTPEYEVVRWLNRRVGSRDVDHFAAAGDLPALVGEMDRAGIGVGVMVGRSTPTVRIGNDELAALAERSAGRLVGIASVDPVELGPEAALAEVRRAVRELGPARRQLRCRLLRARRCAPMPTS